ncbi:hypothetical protein PMZ80_007404 [Knufia obscura]|uniref:trimethyllysine dioxygenase n=1 Tax=Knufia obscura TaxID=1635080 RepID=A0ABR0RH89_9EURO|nr:hypothetical protein PMZ80_007404 [Knufia obscura]
MVNDLRHQEILVNFSEKHTVRYPSFWLRDHCRCSTCTHPHTRQRQINTFELDPDLQATDVTSKPEGLEIIWSGDKHRSLYPWDWLTRHVPFSPAPTQKHPRQDWRHVSPGSANLMQADFNSIINSDADLGALLEQIRAGGFGFISNTPPTPEATQKLLERISFIRPTQYGSFWDFTSEAKPVDTAYTNLSLPLHTDTTYFSDPAGLQLFHCLQSATQGGGQSTFADGFAAAQHLYKVNPDYYNILSSVRIASHASGSSETFGTFMNNAPHAGGFPVFTHSVPHIRPHPRNLTQIRWNNDDRHSSTQFPSHERMIMWYRAARVWQEILASKEFQWEVQLQPGMPVIFDNWRIVHGRRAFEGQRRVCGGYIGMDEFLARARSVNANVTAEAQPDAGKGEEAPATDKEKANEERIKKEQLEEEQVEEKRKEEIEPDVVPQKEEGVDRPIAS